MGGPSIAIPMITLNIELSKTAPAEMSLPIFTLGSRSGWMRSNRYSRDVLIASVIQTRKIARSKNSQLIRDSCKMAASMTTMIVANR
mgnify:CR=1 FL=1